MKPIVAVAGDIVGLTPEGMSINGVPVAGTGRVAGYVERMIAPGQYQVLEDEFWVVANNHPRSFDSRYFGPIERSQIEGVATPLLLLHWP